MLPDALLEGLGPRGEGVVEGVLCDGAWPRCCTGTDRESQSGSIEREAKLHPLPGGLTTNKPNALR